MATATDIQSDAIQSLFPRVVAVVMGLIVILVAVRRSTDDKAWDDAAYVLSIFATGALSVQFLRRQTTKASLLAAVASVCSLVCGIAVVERPQYTPYFWEGFGTAIALLCLPIALTIVPVSAWIRGSVLRARLLALLAISLSLVDLLSLVRDLNNFSVATNNMFLLNEVLAPAANQIPGSDFVPQYAGMLGWIIVPFKHLLSAWGMATLATLLLSALGIGAVLIAAGIARRCLPPRSLWLALSLTVPLASVTVHHGLISSSIGSYLQELPNRMFPALLYSVVAINLIVKLLRSMLPKTALVFSGVLAGLMAWNSQDVGVVVPLAFVIVLLAVTRGAMRWRAVTLWMVGLVPGIAMYPIVAYVMGSPIHFRYFALAVRSSYELAVPIEVPGPVLLVMPVILGSVAVGAALLTKTVNGSIEWSEHQLYALVTLSFIGLWSAVSLVYYVNRSYASAQLQIFLLPLGICCAALLSMCDVRGGIVDMSSLLRRTQRYLRTRALWLFPVTLAVSAGFGSILQTPYPNVAIDALTRPSIGNEFQSTLHESYISPTSFGVIPKYSAIDAVVTLLSYAHRHGGGAVGYIGDNANYLVLATGVQSRILYDDPAVFASSPSAFKLGCSFVHRNPTEWLIVAPGATSFVGASVCGEYEPWTVPNEVTGAVFKLDSSR